MARLEKLTVTALLSSNASEQEQQDEALWAELRGKIKELADDPRYSDLLPSVD